MRILLIEDSDLNADMLQRRLERVGHVVFVAGSGADALALAAAESFDIALLDIRLPDISGVELARELHALQRSCELPLIAVTGDAVPEVLEQARQAGCVDCVTKPIDFNGLLSAIDHAVHIRRHRIVEQRASIQAEPGG
ncbi:MAG: response regulator [Pseudomonadales bacterium]